MGHAQNAAFRLASLSKVRVFLTAEDHGVSTNEPNYWRQKEEEYRSQYLALSAESARLHAHKVRNKLASFPAGIQFWEVEDDEVAACDVQFWQRKEKYYQCHLRDGNLCT